VSLTPIWHIDLDKRECDRLHFLGSAQTRFQSN